MTDDSARPTHLAADVTFAVVPTWVIDCGDSRAVHLYAVLRRYTDQAGQAWPSRATLADRMKCSRPTVDRALAALTKLGALTIVHRFDDAGAMTSSLYRLHAQPGGEPVGRWGGAITRDKGGAITRDASPLSPVTHEREPLNENTPLTPASGGAATACKSHKRPRRGCAPCATPAPERPAWCGECDERTRMREDPIGLVLRCPDCHPIVVAERAQAQP